MKERNGGKFKSGKFYVKNIKSEGKFKLKRRILDFNWNLRNFD